MEDVEKTNLEQFRLLEENDQILHNYCLSHVSSGRVFH